MSVITTIREKLSRKEQKQREQELQDYNSLVVAVADGQEPDAETVERLLTGGTSERPKLQCPTNASHHRIRIRETKGNVQSCICDDCGVEFNREYDPDAEPVGRTVEDLERDVELLKQRRQWKADLDRLPELEESEQQLKAKLEKAREKVAKAITERNKVAEEVEPELRQLGTEKRRAEQHRRKLLNSCRDIQLVERYEALDKRRKQAGLRRRDLKQDLWGYSPVGKLTDVIRGSTGDELLAKEREVDRIAGDHKHPKRHKLNQLSKNLADWKARRYDPLVEEYHRLGSELEQIEAELESLRQQMLEP